jgi:hypothetical protein
MKQTLELFERFASSVVEGSDDLGQILSEIREFNDNPDNQDSMPWLFFDHKSESQIPAKTIDQILVEARKNDLSEEFRVYEIGGWQVVFFSNSGRHFAEQICSEFDIAYSNLQGCGMVYQDKVILAPYLHSEHKLKRELDVVRMILGENKGN